MQPKDVAQMALDIRSVWSYFDMPESALRIWQSVLADIDATTAHAALAKWCKSESKPPAPADIRRLATEIKPPAIQYTHFEQAGPSVGVTLYNRFDPATGDIARLDEPVHMSLDAYREHYREEWRQYHATHPTELAGAAVRFEIDGAP